MASKWSTKTKEELEQIVLNSHSYRSVAEKLGYAPDGGSGIKAVKEMIDFYGFNIEHFTGHAWNKGKTIETDERIISREKYTLEEVFCQNSPVTQKTLRGYIERHELIPYQCSNCGCNGNWQNGIISLEIHHKNGINTDNRLENLTYLCPNCHALTDTYRGLNKKSMGGATGETHTT